MNKEHQAETGEGNAPRMNWAHHRGGKTVVTDSAEDRPFAKAHAERLAKAASKMVAYIDRNWPGKRSERLPVQELREALAQWEAAQ